MNIMVTGASSGIGKAICCSLAESGHNVMAIARSERALELLRSKYPDRISTFDKDVSKSADRQDILERSKSFSSLDGIVHSAGSRIALTPYHELELEKIIEDMKVHVLAPIALNNLLNSSLTNCRIVYIDSYSANSPRAGWAGYSIVKSAAQMAARSAADEITSSRIIRIFPGAVRTPLVNDVLSSNQPSPTADMFKQMDLENQLIDPRLIGNFVANIILYATDSELEERECWDFNTDYDHIFSTK